MTHLNGNLRAAQSAGDDEYYTRLTDIEKELRHYKAQFKGKVVYLNCDDPEESNFFKFFSLQFEAWGLKKLIATSYRSLDGRKFNKSKKSNRAVVLQYTGDKNGNRMPDTHEIVFVPMKGDGDFRSAESIELLKEADIVVTNPPFSLFREYVALMVEHGKKFLVIGPQHAATGKEIFPLIRDGKLWMGYRSGGMTFVRPDGSTKALGNVCWYTNLKVSKREERRDLWRTYDPKTYPTYDNFDAIEVGQVSDIPGDYDGLMGVPITFLADFNPRQFEIVGITLPFDGRFTKRYPAGSKQVNANGVESDGAKNINSGPQLRVSVPPVGKTYYVSGGKFYSKKFARVLIRRVS